MSAGSPDTGQMLGVNPRIDEAPHRGRRRRSTEDMFTVTAALPTPSMQSAPPATAAARSANTAPGA
jgi:hypothetical protein